MPPETPDAQTHQQPVAPIAEGIPYLSPNKEDALLIEEDDGEGGGGGVRSTPEQDLRHAQVSGADGVRFWIRRSLCVCQALGRSEGKDGQVCHGLRGRAVREK